jgi:hypothetical protein
MCLFHPFGLQEFEAAIIPDAWVKLRAFEFMTVSRDGTVAAL